MTVATIEPEAIAGAGELARWAGILPAAAGLAERIANTEFVPEAMRGNAAVVTAAIMYGDELGVGPMQALSGINVIRGKPSPSSELMRALVFRAGHTMRVLKSDGNSCRVVGQRAGEREGTVIEWTIEMARAAGLLESNPTWRRYPRAMLLARATSELCRVVFPDVVKGLGHVADDDTLAGGFDDWATSTTGEREAERTATTVQRKPKPATLPSNLPVDERQRPVADTELPEPPAMPASDALHEPERAEEWPPGIDQPSLPFDGRESPRAAPIDATAGGVPSSAEHAPPVVADPSLPVPDDSEIERDDQSPPGQRMLATIHAMFGDLGITKDERNLRLAITSAAVGRPITTSNELTRREGLALVRVLNDLNQDLLTFGVNPDGSVSIYSSEDEQP